MDIKNFEPLFGNWYIDSFIGAGSFGKVYKIKREDFSGTYYSAVKWISIPQDEAFLKQLQFDGLDKEAIVSYFAGQINDVTKELKLMSQLRGNSNIVSYEDHLIIQKPDRIGYDLFIKMELLTCLNDYIHDIKFTQDDVIQLGIDICSALEACQKFGIVHRDIKPENVFVSNLDHFKLGDFGVSRQLEDTTANLSRKGTLLYMAPEIIKLEKCNLTVDIYSLGILMFQLLNDGRIPFLPEKPNPVSQQDYENSNIQRVSGKPIPLPRDGDGRLGEIVLKACQYAPKDRYSDPKQMKDELQALLQTSSEPQHVSPNVDLQKKEQPEDRKPNDIQKVRVSSLESAVEDIDAVFCFEVSGNMDRMIEDAKKQCLDFQNNLSKSLKSQGVVLRSLRVKVITFGDCDKNFDRAVQETDFFTLPKDEELYQKAIRSIHTNGDGRRHSFGLEALACAIRSKWDHSDSKRKQVIAIWSSAGTYPLEQGKSLEGYIAGMAKDFGVLSDWWGTSSCESRFIRKETKWLILFTPDQPYWSRIRSAWDHVISYSGVYPDELHKVVEKICRKSYWFRPVIK